MSTTELPPSKLGTKEHWDNVYEEELTNFAELGEEGEIWFGQESVDKMVEWVEEYYPTGTGTKPNILEVGSGNGTLLFGLVEAGYDPSTLYGIDYSPGAVRLATEISKTREGAERVTFSQCDFLGEEPSKPRTTDGPSTTADGGAGTEGGVAIWDLLLDKGTYDAIALGVKDSEGRSPAVNYPSRVERLLKPGGHFLITSCNFTEDELKQHFTAQGTNLKYHSRVQHPTFTYGGKSGSICSTVAFEKL